MKKEVLVSGNFLVNCFFIVSALLIIPQYLFYSSIYFMYFLEGLFSGKVNFFEFLFYSFPESLYFVLTPFLLYFIIQGIFFFTRKKPIHKSVIFVIFLMICGILFLIATFSFWDLFVQGLTGFLGIQSYLGQTISVYIFSMLYFFTLCFATISSFLLSWVYGRNN
ncbi:MAG: hypothetical protein WC254_06470 [Candidatus Woesearchaeota archaeon]|jgi:hypothetical protein